MTILFTLIGVITGLLWMSSRTPGTYSPGRVIVWGISWVLTVNAIGSLILFMA